MFDTIYQWVLTDLIGPSVMLGSFIHPLAFSDDYCVMVYVDMVCFSIL